MLYRNEKTGAVIDVKSTLGGLWKPVSEKVQASSSSEEVKTTPKKKTTKKRA